MNDPVFQALHPLGAKSSRQNCPLTPPQDPPLPLLPHPDPPLSLPPPPPQNHPVKLHQYPKRSPLSGHLPLNLPLIVLLHLPPLRLLLLRGPLLPGSLQLKSTIRSRQTCNQAMSRSPNLTWWLSILFTSPGQTHTCTWSGRRAIIQTGHITLLAHSTLPSKPGPIWTHQTPSSARGTHCLQTAAWLLLVDILPMLDGRLAFRISAHIRLETRG